MEEMDALYCQYDPASSEFSTSSCDDSESSDSDDEIIFNKKAKNQKYNYKSMSMEQKKDLLVKSLASFNTILKTLKIKWLNQVYFE